MQMVIGKFLELPISMSFLQIKSAMSLLEKIWQVNHEIC
jgi:hypothetical protein